MDDDKIKIEDRLFLRNVEASVEFYFEPLETAFNKHMEMVASYRERIMKEMKIDLEGWGFFVTFIIEDGSLFAAVADDGRLLPPIRVKESMDASRAQSGVNCLMRSSGTNENKWTWVVSKKDAYNPMVLSDERSIDAIKLCGFKPGQIEIPFETIDYFRACRKGLLN